MKCETYRVKLNVYTFNFRFFFVVYLFEMIIKMCAYGFIGYFKSHWNKLDFFIIVMATGGKRDSLKKLTSNLLWVYFVTTRCRARRCRG